MARGHITAEAAHEVARRLAGGESHRAVSDATGVSRGSVGAIARGERGLHGTPAEAPDHTPPAADDCRGSGCGDCVACRARRGGKGRPPAACPDPVPRLSHAEIRRRAAEIRAEGGGTLVDPVQARRAGTLPADYVAEPEPVETPVVRFSLEDLPSGVSFLD